MATVSVWRCSLEWAGVLARPKLSSGAAPEAMAIRRHGLRLEVRVECGAVVLGALHMSTPRRESQTQACARCEGTVRPPIGLRCPCEGVNDTATTTLRYGSVKRVASHRTLTAQDGTALRLVALYPPVGASSPGSTPPRRYTGACVVSRSPLHSRCRCHGEGVASFSLPTTTKSLSATCCTVSICKTYILPWRRHRRCPFLRPSPGPLKSLSSMDTAKHF
jgi:hypothetical protein